MSKEEQKEGLISFLARLIVQGLIGTSLLIPAFWELGRHVLTGGFGFAVHVWLAVLTVTSFFWMLSASHLVVLLAQRSSVSRGTKLLFAILTVVGVGVFFGYLRAHRQEPPKMKLVIRVRQEMPGMPQLLLLHRGLPQFLAELQPRIEAKFDAERHCFEFVNIRGGEWWLAPQPETAYPQVGPITLPAQEGGIHEISNILPMEPLTSVESVGTTPPSPSVELVGNAEKQQNSTVSQTTDAPNLPRERLGSRSDVPMSPSAAKPSTTVSRKGLTPSPQASSPSVSSADKIPEGFSLEGRRVLDPIMAKQEIANAKELRQSNPSEAERIFRRVIQSYPGTKAADEAQKELDSMLGKGKGNGK